MVRPAALGDSLQIREAPDTETSLAVHNPHSNGVDKHSVGLGPKREISPGICKYDSSSEKARIGAAFCHTLMWGMTLADVYDIPRRTLHQSRQTYALSKV
jgi:hypothetical protein